MRATRERMERVKLTAVTLAYSFAMTTNAYPSTGYTREELRVVI